MGGAEHVLVDIANRMAEDGFSVTVQTLLDEGIFRERLNRKVTYKKGIRTNSEFMKKVVMKLYYVLPASLLGRFFIDQGYTHLVAFVEDLPTKIVYGYPGHDAKKIAWVHTDLYKNQDAKQSFGTIEKTRGCYPSFDQVLCVSNDVKEGFLKRVGLHRALDVQYNPLNKEKILEKALCKPEYSVRNTQALRIVALGRLVKVKGFDLLIEAMVRVRKEACEPVELYIIGGGNQEMELKQLIRTYQLQDTVFLCGQQINPYSIMRQCDIQVISSRAEGYSLALCEGHFLGLPVVATKCAGPVELLSASNGGILVDISPEGLTEGILSMVNDPARRNEYKQNAELWSDRYDADVVYRQIENRFA